MSNKRVTAHAVPLETAKRINNSIWHCCYPVLKIVFCAIIFVLTTAAIVALILIFSPSSDHVLHVGDYKTNEEKGYDILVKIMRTNMSNIHFTQELQDQFEQAFSLIDENGDDNLNFIEFQSFFELHLDNVNAFTTLDVNKDDRLSFAECVAYLEAISEIEDVSLDLMSTVGQQSIFEYGLKVEDVSNNDMFMQYAATFLYFEEFDVSSNGYIEYADYFEISSQNAFASMDLNKDNEISTDEFSNTLFGRSNTSWNGKLESIFGDNYKNVMLSLKEIEVTTTTIESIESSLTLGPLDIMDMKRSVNSTANREYICYQDVLCYFAYFGKDAKEKKHIFDPSNSIDSSLVVDNVFIDGKVLNKEDEQIANEAANKCHDKHCCRLDDDEFAFSDSKCHKIYNYLECISSENECIWECALPQSNTSIIHYKHIFNGIDRKIAKPINQPQKLIKPADAENDHFEEEQDHLSMETMDECGTTYQLQVTPKSLQREKDDDKSSAFSYSKPEEGSKSRRMYVLGNDDRRSITKYESPYHKNVFILFSTSTGWSRCSGSLISPKHVLTAGHCVSDGAGNYYSDFVVYPSLNAGNFGSSLKFDSFQGTSVWTFSRWHRRGSYNWDIGIITLDTTDTGYGYFAFGYDDSISTSHEFDVNGYPADKGLFLQQQYMTMDYGVYDHLLTTQSGDIVGGNSGGPAWDPSNEIIYGVVSHEAYGYSGSRWNPVLYFYNGLTRITKSKYDAMCAYLRTFPETDDIC